MVYCNTITTLWWPMLRVTVSWTKVMMSDRSYAYYDMFEELMAHDYIFDCHIQSILLYYLLVAHTSVAQNTFTSRGFEWNETASSFGCNCQWAFGRWSVNDLLTLIMIMISLSRAFAQLLGGIEFIELHGSDPSNQGLSVDRAHDGIQLTLSIASILNLISICYYRSVFPYVCSEIGLGALWKVYLRDSWGLTLDHSGCSHYSTYG